MKHIITMVFLFLALLSGCAEQGEVPSMQTPETSTAINPETTRSSSPFYGGMAEPEKSVDPTPSAGVSSTPEVKEEREITLYLPNGSVDGFVEERENVKIDPQSVVDALIFHGALPEGVKVIDFRLEEGGKHIALELSREFETALCSTGTSGEAMLTGSLVNTMLMCWGAERLFFTCEGRIVESGHVVYDFPLSFSGMK